MIESFDTTRAVIALNQSYLISAAELCRRYPPMARIALHLSAEDVAAFAKITAADLNWVNAIPIALVHPHGHALQVLNAKSPADILAPTQAAVDRFLREGR